MPVSSAFMLRWQDLIFKNGVGSVKSNDTLFRRRYNRGYFAYGLDTAKNVLGFRKRIGDKNYILEFKYAIPDSSTITMAGLHGKDSLYVELKQHFQIAERQFHWLSEQNRQG